MPPAAACAAGRFETRAAAGYTALVGTGTTRLVAIVLAATLPAAGCDREFAHRPNLCVAPDPSLAGAAPYPASLASRIASVEIPARALLSDRVTCNRLALEPGAFAKRHALDPIDWRPWSREALDLAAAEDRPVLALTGDSSCAACNDLGRSAFAAEQLARTINERFVPLIVDREARPDVDAYLMLGVQVLTGGAGWPAIVLLLPGGRPFAAESWGAAAVTARSPERLVTEVVRRMELGGGTIEERAESTVEKMGRRAAIDTSGPMPDADATSSALLDLVVASFDADAGTFGDPPLFPRTPLLDFLVERGRRGDQRALAVATAALGRLQESPLFDRGRGGFFRFARGERWQDPAPEKNLADNAALARTFLEAGETAARADFLETARRTLGFLEQDLRREDGTFATSLATSASPPVRDERVLADANALAISALARASTVLAVPRWLEVATTAARALDARLRRGSRVLHCGDPDCAGGYLADHVLLALADLDLAEAASPREDEGRLAAARAIADALPAHFGHEASGGFFQTTADAEPLPVRVKPALDTSVASGNSAAALLFVRLAARDARYREEARRTFEAFSEVLALRPFALPSMVAALAGFADEAAAAGDQEAAGGPGAASAPPQLEPAPAVQP